MLNQAKLETPSRLRELNPVGTLERIGMKEGMTLCDVGAGTGVFAIPAAMLPAQTVYALDVNDEALRVIDTKAREAKLHNVETVLIDGPDYDVPAESCDMILLSCVLHEIEEEEREEAFSEFRRIIAPNGSVAVIEFSPEAEGFGPPRDIRISQARLEEHAEEWGFTPKKRFVLSPNLYCVVFGK
jgi:ubiquinone/menaquinone biosynthesis C-methylase UbiE